MDADTLQFFGSADNITATLVASVVIYQLTHKMYARTVGSKKHLRAKLDALTCGNPVEYVTSLFGEPVYKDQPAVRGSTIRHYKAVAVERRLYSTAHGWLVVHFAEGAVGAYAFTVTNRRFKYDIASQTFGLAVGVLGHNTFHEISPVKPDSVESFIGAATYGYSEISYHGRPGRYQNYGLSSTMNGRSNIPGGPIPPGCIRWGRFSEQHETFEEVSSEDERAVSTYRMQSSPDTFAVFGPDFDPFIYNYLDASGSVHHDRLRIIGGKGPRGWVVERSVLAGSTRKARVVRAITTRRPRRTQES